MPRRPGYNLSMPPLTRKARYRQRLKLQVALARQASEGQQSKTEMVYQYLTGPRFRQRIEAIVEAFSSMQEDLDRENSHIVRIRFSKFVFRPRRFSVWID